MTWKQVSRFLSTAGFLAIIAVQFPDFLDGTASILATSDGRFMAALHLPGPVPREAIYPMIGLTVLHLLGRHPLTTGPAWGSGQLGR